MNMKSNLLFHTLEQVDSTNNYAMGKIAEGSAVHGMAWYSSNQTNGKGQRGKHWEGKTGENIALSVVSTPPAYFLQSPFLFNAWISLVCRRFLAETIHEKVLIKWPNDLMVCDRKAGGILIENKYRGNNWNWSIVGIGINVNQTNFSNEAKCPVSLKQITGLTYQPEKLARDLHIEILNSFEKISNLNLKEVWNEYHLFLYKMGELVSFKKDDAIIETVVVGVNEQGELQTKDTIERTFQFGEAEWII